MVTSDARTPDQYIAALPDDRREAVRAVRDVVRDNLPAGFEEGMVPETPDSAFRSAVRSSTDAARHGSG